MEFASFTQALQICMTAEEGGAEQQAALAYCLANAPADLRAMLERRLVAAEVHDGHDCGCGCKG